jgi:hypothetical protein
MFGFDVRIQVGRPLNRGHHSSYLIAEFRTHHNLAGRQQGKDIEAARRLVRTSLRHLLAVSEDRYDRLRNEVMDDEAPQFGAIREYRPRIRHFVDGSDLPPLTFACD